MSWWKALPTLSEAIFPGISTSTKSRGPNVKYQTIASLPLQVVIYFNIWFYPVWLVTSIAIMSVKINYLTNLYRFIAVTVLVSVASIEILRLYLGYFGNLYEKIPEVAAFWMLSILLQFPLQTFMTVNKNFDLQPIEYTVQGVMLVMLVAQLFIGFHALRFAARTQAARFHMMQMQAAASSRDAGTSDSWRF